MFNCILGLGQKHLSLYYQHNVYSDNSCYLTKGGKEKLHKELPTAQAATEKSQDSPTYVTKQQCHLSKSHYRKQELKKDPEHLKEKKKRQKITHVICSAPCLHSHEMTPKKLFYCKMQPNTQC